MVKKTLIVEARSTKLIGINTRLGEFKRKVYLIYIDRRLNIKSSWPRDFRKNWGELTPGHSLTALLNQQQSLSEHWVFV